MDRPLWTGPGRRTGRLCGAGLLTALLWLGGCASTTPPAQLPPQLLVDSAFRTEGHAVVQAEEVFALSEGMRAFLSAHPGLHPRAADRERQLLDALQQGGPLRLAYDSASTRTAAELERLQQGP